MKPADAAGGGSSEPALGDCRGEGSTPTSVACHASALPQDGASDTSPSAVGSAADFSKGSSGMPVVSKQWAVHLEQIIREVGLQHTQASDTFQQRVLAHFKRQEHALDAILRFQPKEQLPSPSSSALGRERSASDTTGHHAGHLSEIFPDKKLAFSLPTQHGISPKVEHSNPTSPSALAPIIERSGIHHAGHALNESLPDKKLAFSLPTQHGTSPKVEAQPRHAQYFSENSEPLMGHALSESLPDKKIVFSLPSQNPHSLSAKDLVSKQPALPHSAIPSDLPPKQSDENKKSEEGSHSSKEDEAQDHPTCECGNIFLSDALFCRKCGEPRPNACGCGNILKHDAVFCRKCGRSREDAIEFASEAKVSPPEPTQRRGGRASIAFGPMLSQTSAGRKSVVGRPGGRASVVGRASVAFSTAGSGRQSQAANRMKKTEMTKFSDSEQALKDKHKDKQEAKIKQLEYDFTDIEDIDNHGVHSKALAFCIGHVYFDMICAGVLISNAAFVGLTVDIQACSPSGKIPNTYKVVDLAYTGWFLIELLMRLGGQGPYLFFIMGEELSWNYFDLGIVVSCLLDAVLDLLAMKDGNSVFSNLSALRTLRVMRVIRVARVIRLMRFFRSLRLLIRAIFNTVKSCIWTALLLFMLLYMFGILFAQGVSDYMHDDANLWALGLSEDTDFLRIHFGTLPRSIFTCCQAILGGMDWGLAAAALSDVGSFYVGTFVLMVTFIALAVMNVISGLFLQSSIEQAQADKDDIVAQHQNDRQKHVRNFKKVFNELDTDGDNAVCLEEFQVAVEEQDTIKDFLMAMDIEAGDAWLLFKLLDVDSGGHLDMDAFVDGCMQLKGSAKSIHVAQLVYENKWLMDAMTDLAQYCSDSFQILSDQLEGGHNEYYDAASNGRCSTSTLGPSLRSSAFGPNLLPTTPGFGNPSTGDGCHPPSVDPPLLSVEPLPSVKRIRFGGDDAEATVD